MMDKPGWTPGPWEADEQTCDVESDDGIVAWVTSPDEICGSPCEPETFANANLIAAAPALAKAAEPFVRELDGLEDESDDLPIGVFTTTVTIGEFRALAAAYRKALGET